jgi:hypothetical protein
MKNCACLKSLVSFKTFWYSLTSIVLIVANMFYSAIIYGFQCYKNPTFPAITEQSWNKFESPILFINKAKW